MCDGKKTKKNKNKNLERTLMCQSRVYQEQVLQLVKNTVTSHVDVNIISKKVKLHKLE